VTAVAKVSEGGEHVADLIRSGRVDLVVNTPFGRGPRTDGWHIRTAAAEAHIPCVTTLPGFFAAVRGIEALRRGGGTGPRPLQERLGLPKAGPVQQGLPIEPPPAGSLSQTTSSGATAT
jgi:carbamoyl-phosphate synthase large subunit